MRPRKNAIAPEDRKTIGYVRVSTQEQANEGVSLDAQEARIGAYCLAMDWDVSEVIRDAGKSAKSLKRPGMAKVLAGIRDGSIERVIVLKLDRLTRNRRDLDEIIDDCAKHNVALVSITQVLDTSTPTGRAMIAIQGVFSQLQREQIGENTAEMLAHKRQRRTAYGPTPFGFVRVGKALIPEPTERAALDEAVRMDRSGASYREIAARLTELGVKPHRGKAWYASSVSAILRSKMAQEVAAA
jgi:DNA invertase Pin-like site-specific DNA recombinase